MRFMYETEAGRAVTDISSVLTCDSIPVQFGRSYSFRFENCCAVRFITTDSQDIYILCTEKEQDNILATLFQEGMIDLSDYYDTTFVLISAIDKATLEEAVSKVVMGKTARSKIVKKLATVKTNKEQNNFLGLDSIDLVDKNDDSMLPQ